MKSWGINWLVTVVFSQIGVSAIWLYLVGFSLETGLSKIENSLFCILFCIELSA